MRGLPLSIVAFVLVVLAVPAVAYADPPGKAAILDYYDDLPPTIRQSLGNSPQGVVAAGAGSKMVFQHGAIYWHEAAGAALVDGGTWTKYLAMNAENGPLGFPVDELTGDSVSGGNPCCILAQDFQYGAIVRHPGAGVYHAVFGSAFTIWEKNGRSDGPLGVPINDTQITTSGSPFPIITFVSQAFEGATIDYNVYRAISGDPLWLATPNHDLTTRAVVEMPVVLTTATATCELTLSRSFWAHGLAGTPRERTLVGNAWCGTGGSSKHRVRAEVELNYRVQSGSRFALDGFSMYLNGSTNNTWDFYFGQSISWTVTVRPGQEETFYADWSADASDSWPVGKWAADSIYVERLTLRSVPIEATDIKF